MVFLHLSWRMSAWKKRMKLSKDDGWQLLERRTHRKSKQDLLGRLSLDAPAQLALACWLFTNPTFSRDFNFFSFVTSLIFRIPSIQFPIFIRSHCVINSPSPFITLSMRNFLWTIDSRNVFSGPYTSPYWDGPGFLLNFSGCHCLQ